MIPKFDGLKKCRDPSPTETRNKYFDPMATDVAKALKAAGAEQVYLAGHPGERRADYEAAGIDGFIHIGVDVLAVLQDAHDKLGVAAS